MNKQKLLIIGLGILLIMGVIILSVGFFNPNNDSSTIKTSQPFNADFDFDNLAIIPAPLSEDQLSTINQISTSEDLLNYINSNILITPEVDLLTKQPSETLSTLKGNKSDVAVLINEMFRQKGISSSVLLYKYNDNQEQVDLIIPFRDIDEPRYIFFEDNKVNMKHHGWSYSEMFDAEELRTGRKMEEYCILNLFSGYMKTVECSPREEEIRKYHFIVEE